MSWTKILNEFKLYKKYYVNNYCFWLKYFVKLKFNVNNSNGELRPFGFLKILSKNEIEQLKNSITSIKITKEQLLDLNILLKFTKLNYNEIDNFLYRTGKLYWDIYYNIYDLYFENYKMHIFFTNFKKKKIGNFATINIQTF